MEGILSAKLKHSQVTVEVEQRKPDSEEIDDNGQPYFFPTLLNKAVLKVKTAHLQKNLGNQQSDETATGKQRSLFLLNLPETVDAAFLRILFPTCLRCTITQLSGNMRSAILLTRSTKTAVHLLASIAEFHIDEKTIHMGTSEVSKKEADELIANEAEATTAPLLDTGPASNSLAQSVANTASSQNPAQLPFIKNTGQKTRLKRKSPSDVKRDIARRLKNDQKRLSLLPPAPLFPDEPSFNSMSTNDRRHLEAASNIPPVPPFPDEFRLMSMSAAESRHPRAAGNFPPVPYFSDDFRLTSMSEVESRDSYIPPAPPFPDEFRLMSMSAAESRHPRAPRMSMSAAANGSKKTAARVHTPKSGPRPPGVSRIRSAYKIKRDKIRAEEFYAKKRKAQEEQEKANSSSENVKDNVSTATAVPSGATQLQEPISDSMTKPDGKMPRQQQTAPYSESQHSGMDIQGIQPQNTNPCHSTHKAGASDSLQTSSGTRSKEKTKLHVQQTQQERQTPASSDWQQHNRSGDSSDRFHWNRNKPANSALRTDHRPNRPKDDCWHSDVPLESSEAQRPAPFGRDHHARDTAREEEYYAAREDYDYERARAAREAYDYERAVAAREAYDYERAVAAREAYDYERAVAAREVHDLELARAAWRDYYY
ncbi:hypothetical protein V1264_013002 [Littorina saxatilis]|uniref:Uncharacterized protein n=2 Tax=Littorina saxatilis TaxID=31220 RepID=A0AAN9GM73_9CAEN